MKSWGPRPFETVGDASLSSLCVVPPFLYPPLNELPTNNVNERADFSTSQPSPLCSIPFSLSLPLSLSPSLHPILFSETTRGTVSSLHQSVYTHEPKQKRFIFALVHIVFWWFTCNKGGFLTRDISSSYSSRGC